MGTFTVTYWLRKAVWDKKHLWGASIFAGYIGVCWDRAGYTKAEMMKGHSRMFADRVKSLPPNADPWKW